VRAWSVRRKVLTFGLGSIVLVAVAIPVAIFIYIHFVEGPPPKKLSLDATPTNSAASGELVPVEGTWAVAAESKVGYRVKEVLLGQSATAVGRTSDVTGSMTVTGTTVSAASFTAQLATVTSDEGKRDSQFRNRIMDVKQFPTATFVMSKPVFLDPVPPANVVANYQISGKLTMHGVTKDITIDLAAKRVGGTISVNGEIPITFADYSISNPSAGPARVGDDGTLEVLLVFTKQG
jgi:polyisoprenoid-binding protein YceI